MHISCQRALTHFGNDRFLSRWVHLAHSWLRLVAYYSVQWPFIVLCIFLAADARMHFRKCLHFQFIVKMALNTIIGFVCDTRYCRQTIQWIEIAQIDFDDNNRRCHRCVASIGQQKCFFSYQSKQLAVIESNWTTEIVHTKYSVSTIDQVNSHNYWSLLCAIAHGDTRSFVPINAPHFTSLASLFSTTFS